MPGWDHLFSTGNRCALRRWDRDNRLRVGCTCFLPHHPNSAIIIIIINPLTVRVIGAPQMILQPVFSNFLSSPLPSRPVYFPRLSSHLFLCLPYLLPLSLCLARWFWPDLMNRKHDHTTAVCVPLLSSGLHVAQLPAGSCHRLPCW